MKEIKYILILVLATGIVACKKKNKEDEEEPVSTVLSNGLLVVNEGLFQQNNSSLSWVDLSTGNANNTIFEQKTGRFLGDTGNDIQRYGGKIYVVVTVSSTIEVLDASTLSPVAQIPMLVGTVAKQPRSIVFSGAKAFVTCYDGYVDVIDTATLSVQQRIQVGANPERMAVAGSKLFVTNSGGLNYPDVDSTVSVIDIPTLTESNKIVIGNNPGDIVYGSNGMIYAISRGDYSTIPSRMHRIDPINETVQESYTFDASSIATFNNDLLLTYNSASTTKVALFSYAANSITNPDFLDLSMFTTIYNVQFDPHSQNIYCFDAMGYTNSGYVRKFNNSGTYVSSYHVGLNPSKLVVYE